MEDKALDLEIKQRRESLASKYSDTQPMSARSTVDFVSMMVGETFASLGGSMVTKEHLSTMMNKVIGPVVKEAIARATTPLIERIAHLEETALRYEGVYDAGGDYGKGDMVTYKNSLWVCRTTGTKAIPGDGPYWKLVARGDRPQ